MQTPYRTYRQGWVFRNEKPGPGRFRQFMQFDADTVGAPGVQADAEMCMMMADTMEALGIARGDYVIRVNNRKVLDGVMEAIGVTDAGQKLAVLRAIDKLDKFDVEGVRLLLGPGRWENHPDESGDFTKGAGLGEPAKRTLIHQRRFRTRLCFRNILIRIWLQSRQLSLMILIRIMTATKKVCQNFQLSCTFSKQMVTERTGS